jgi:hypothetical protein
VTEAGMDAQVLTLFDRLKIQDEKVRDWFLKVQRAGTREGQVQSEEKIAELNRQFTVLRSQQGRLLNLRLLDEIDEQTFAVRTSRCGIGSPPRTCRCRDATAHGRNRASANADAPMG